jgi:hypothetical protein
MYQQVRVSVQQCQQAAARVLVLQQQGIWVSYQQAEAKVRSFSGRSSSSSWHCRVVMSLWTQV